MKSVLRNQLRLAYQEMTDDARKNIDSRLIMRLMGHDLYKNCSRIFLYASVGSEIDTHTLINSAYSAGKTVALPKCKSAGLMEFHRYQGRLLTGKFSIPEPESDEILSPEKNDLMIVPGLAFDKQGYRVGQGGGYYDRYLARFDCVKIGLCRDIFLLEEVPVQWNDLPVDYVITETETYQCKKTELP